MSEIDGLITINVRGRLFQITEEIVQHFPPQRFEQALRKSSRSRNGCYYFDRNPAIFEAVLDFYSSGKLHVPGNTCGQLVREELNFWAVSESNISPCCWRTFYAADDTMDNLNELGFAGVGGDCENKSTLDPTWRLKIWMFLDNPLSSVPARCWDALYYLVLAASFVVDCLDTVPMFRGTPDFDQRDRLQSLNVTNPKKLLLMSTQSSEIIHRLQVGIATFFALEFLARLLLCPNKKTFVKKPLNILEFVVLPAMCLDISFHIWLHHSQEHDEDVMVLFVILIIVKHFRLLRFFRLGKQFPGLKVFLLVIKTSRMEMFLFIFCMMVNVAIGSTFIYAAEFGEAHTFDTMFAAIWWAVITLTTVGYGDVYPMSVQGRIWGSITAILGLIAIALPITLVASNFGDLYNLYRDNARRKRLSCKSASDKHSTNLLSANRSKNSAVAPCS